MLDGAPFRFPDALPDDRGGRREVHDSHRRTDGKVAGVTNGTTVIVRFPMFVDDRGGLQAHKAGQQQRYQERSEQPPRCGYTNHARLFDDCSGSLVSDCWGNEAWQQKMRRAVHRGRPFCEASLVRLRGELRSRPAGPLALA